MEIYVNPPSYPDLRSHVFIEPNHVTKAIVEKCIDRIGCKAVKHLCNKKTYPRFWLARYKLSLDTFFKLCEFLNLDPLEKLENQILSSRSTRGRIIFTSKLIERLSLIDAAVRGDGYISKNGEIIRIYQNEIDYLEKLCRLVNEISLEKCAFVYSRKDRKTNELIITSRPIAWMLTNLMKNPIGKKPFELSGPPQLPRWKRDKKLGWLANLYVCEGSFYFDKGPRVGLKMTSTLPCRVYNILKDIGYNPVMVRLANGDWCVNINKYFECASFCHEVYPFVYSKEKCNQILSFLSNRQFLEGLRLRIPYLVCNAIEKAGSQSKLARLINLKLGYNFVREAVRDWLLPQRKVGLRIVLFLSDYLEVDFFDILPRKLGLLLYAQKIIPEHETKIA